MCYGVGIAMSLTEYWDYIQKIYASCRMRFPHATNEQIDVFLKLAASPYHYWLENRAIMGKGNVCNSDDTRKAVVSEEQPHSPPNAEERVVNAIASAHESDIAQKLRELIREDIKKYLQEWFKCPC
jgi:hypothetical protein